MDKVIIGDATLYHGDCMDILPALAYPEDRCIYCGQLPDRGAQCCDNYNGKVVDSNGIDAIVTDPPYGIADKGGKWGRKTELVWDRGTSQDIITYLVDISQFQIIWGGNYYELRPSRGWLVWYKRDSVPSSADVELAWTNLDMNSRLIDCTISSTNPERNGHPTIKPVRVMRWCLTFLPDVKTICDPFMGSGTTGVACAHERIFIGIEKERKYFDIACERIDAAYSQGRFSF